MLVSFNFLFRIESARLPPQATALSLSDLDLASRLSFFLWSSIPDEQLLTLASAAGSANRPSSSSKCAGCCAIRARARWSTTSPASG